MNHRLLILTALCCAAGAATAGEVFRCGPDGRVFSQTPCPGGTSVAIAEPPSAQQQAEARRIAQRDQRLADEMEQSRKAEEAALEPKRAASLTARPRKVERKARADEANSKTWYTKPHTGRHKKNPRKVVD